MSRRYSNNNGDSTFVIVVLAAGFYWTHRDLVVRIGQIAAICAIVILFLVCVRRIYKVFGEIQAWLNPTQPDLAEIDVMSGLEFELYVAELLKQQGYQHVRLTEKYDYGIDIIAVRDGFTWGIQVKRSSGLVKANAVRQVVTALRMYGCDRAMVITNGEFSRIARDLAASNDCVLVDRCVFWSGAAF